VERPSPHLTVIIPAHNEGAVIERCLDSLLNSDSRLVIEVVVVCNGCQDDTAERARRFGDRVTVIETDFPSKWNALNLGDGVARGVHRAFIDADVRLGPGALEQVVWVLDEGAVLVAAPRIRFDLSNSSWAVRAFYGVWNRLPYLRAGMVGSGFYAVSAEGRKRFDRFPPITADDGFVHRCFQPSERLTLNECEFVVTAPADLTSLIKIKTRAHFGGIELEHHYPDMMAHPGDGHSGALLRLAFNPLNWPSLSVYWFVRVVSRARARKRWRSGDHTRWERDESSRVGAA